MRTLLLTHPDRRVVYWSDFSDYAEAKESFIQSLQAAGFSVEEESGLSVDELSNPNVAKTLAEKAATEGAYVIVNVSDVEKLFMLEHVADAYDANLLAIVPQSMKRKTLQALLKGQTAERVYTLIVP